MILHLAVALREGGDAPAIATLRAGWLTERASAAGIPVWLEPQRPGLDLAWVWRLARRLRAEQIDVFHSHEFAMNVFGGVAARIAGVRSVATIHGRHWVADRPRRSLAYRLLRRLGMSLVVVSEDLAEHLAPRLGLARQDLLVILNGIPLDPFAAASRGGRRPEARAGLGVPANAPLLVAIGNLYPVKDHATLVRAAARLPLVHVAIAGRGPEEPRLRELAAELGVEKRVRLLGLRDDIASLLGAADVLVHPSRSEGLPLAILEAMAAGLPVVATRVGGIPEAVADGETGLLVPAADPEALAAALAGLLERPEERSRLGQAGRRRAEREFSVEAMRDRYAAVYDARRVAAHLREETAPRRGLAP
jgi:glycosyltransferase involved in cell wall biosynthesis